MAILDAQGRLFGKLNLIDAAVALFVLALVPLAYASWVFFRTPSPVLTGITPPVVHAGGGQMIALHGRHLRPYLRVFVGSNPAEYLFASPERAEIRLPPLQVGSFDVAVFDGADELARFPNAVTLSADELLLQVRFQVRPEVLEHVRSTLPQPNGPTPSTASGPVVESYELTDDLLGTTKQDLLQGRLNVIRAVVRVFAVKTGDGWRLDDQTLCVGCSLTIRTPTYRLTNGDILSIRAATAQPE